jgi:pilus assembly protein TadC
MSWAALGAGLAGGAAYLCRGESQVGRRRIATLTGAVAGRSSVPERPRAMVEHRWAEGRARGPALVAVAVAGLLVLLRVAGAGGLVVASPGVAVLLAPLARSRAAAREERRRCEAALPRAADLVAACLAVGAAPADALETVSRAVGGPLQARLAPVVVAMRLGADPVAAYLRTRPGGRRGDSPRGVLARAARPGGEDMVEALVRSVARAVHSGARLADAATLVADEARQRRRWAAEAAARRAGVLAVGPLVLCYLPAFLLLGVVPIVLAVAGQALGGLR